MPAHQKWFNMKNVRAQTNKRNPNRNAYIRRVSPWFLDLFVFRWSWSTTQKRIEQQIRNADWQQQQQQLQKLLFFYRHYPSLGDFNNWFWSLKHSDESLAPKSKEEIKRKKQHF